jgi:hypothetical protein
VSVYSATLAELSDLGPTVAETVEGQRALNLAAVLDDRAGIQAGGVASTDKQLGVLMGEIREKYKVPERKGRLELLRDPDSATG